MSDFNEIKTPDMNEPWDGEGLPVGAKGGMLAILGVLVGVALPYLLTAVAGEESPVGEKVGMMRAWLPGDSLPFQKIFGGGKAGHHDEPAAPEGAPIAGVDGEPEVPAAPVITIDPTPARAPGPAPATTHPLARIHIPATTWEGLGNFIEDPSGAMRTFYDKLAKVALKDPGAIVRISHYGDSAIAADGMPSSARRLLQRTFGDGGHGFSLAAASNNWYRRKDIQWSTQGFQTEVFIADEAKDERYGFAGTAAVGFQGARASWRTVEGPEGTVGTRASRFQVYYQAMKGGGRMALSVDGVEQQLVDTASDTKEDRVVTIEVPDGPHTFEVKNVGGGKTKIYGAVIERSAGVVYDGLGTIGARDTRWLNMDADHVRRMIPQRGTDLGVFMYGGNQLEDKLSMERYKESLTEVVRLWRAALDGKSCLVMSPIDHGERHRGRVRTVPRQVEIMKVQREVALAEGCAWFSLYDAMGGNGAIGQWHDEGLAEGDLAHPTAKGAVVLGQLFFKALMQGFSGHIAGGAAEPTP